MMNGQPRTLRDEKLRAKEKADARVILEIADQIMKEYAELFKKLAK